MDKFLSIILPGDEKLITAEPPQHGCVYHISTNGKIPAFVPAVSNRTITKEDRRVPRICSAETLWNCFLGYAATVDEFYNLAPNDWRGGYYIYRLPCDLIAKPDKKLLPDVVKTKETWILGYDEKHQSIEPEIIGKCFFYSVLFKRTRECPIYDLEIYLELKQPMCVLDTKVMMEPGYYKLTIVDITDVVSWDLKNATIVAIDSKDYRDTKKLTAGTLSFDSGSVDLW